MESGMRVWDFPHMRKPKPPRGISARLPAIFKAVKPDKMSMAKWMDAARVSPKFVNDIEDGAEPGIDKVERMANAVGMTLAELIDGKSAASETQDATHNLLSVEEWTVILKALEQPLSAGPSTEGDFQALAQMLDGILTYCRTHPDRVDTLERLEAAARAIVDRPAPPQA